MDNKTDTWESMVQQQRSKDNTTSRGDCARMIRKNIY